MGLMGWKAKKQMNWLWKVLEYVGRPDGQEDGWSETRLFEASCLEGAMAVLVMSEWRER